MSVTWKPVFAQTLDIATCVCTAAKTDLTNTTNGVLLYTAAGDGVLVTRLGAMPRNTTGSAIQLQIFLSQDSGTTLNLIGSAAMASYTMATTTAVPYTPITDLNGLYYSMTNPLFLKSGDRLYAGIGVALAAGVMFQAHLAKL